MCEGFAEVEVEVKARAGDRVLVCKLYIQG